MRVTVEQPMGSVDPGRRLEVRVTVHHDGPRDDTFSARLVGLGGATSTCVPAPLRLHPGGSGELLLTVEVPTDTPAQLHQCLVEVVSGAEQVVERAAVDVQVTRAHEVVHAVVEQPVVHLVPGTPTEVRVRVRNRGAIIDGFTAELVGLDDATVTPTPALNLFPDAEGHLVLTVEAPATLRAGLHPCAVRVQSQTLSSAVYAPVDVEVEPQPALALTREKRMIRARRGARFVLFLHNDGNVPLEATLAAPPADPGTSVRLTPSTVAVPAGAVVKVFAAVRGPRMLLGGEIDRTVGVELSARRGLSVAARPRLADGTRPAEPDAAAEAQAAADARRDAVEPLPELASSTTLQLRQRPLVSRGVVTLLILATIVGAWAAVFLLGLQHSFGDEPQAKDAPESFSGATTVVGGVATVANETPVGALDRAGIVPEGVGGSISGVVTARSDGRPVGRILVTAWRDTPNGKAQVSQVATESDGSYELDALFPTRYRLEFSADGYQSVWSGGGTTFSKAKNVAVLSGVGAVNRDAVISGLPGSITGSVDPGDPLTQVQATVTARLLGPSEAVVKSGRDQPVKVRARPDGSFTLPALVSPATYELTVSADVDGNAFPPTQVVQDLAGGEQRQVPDILLTAGDGQISGLVTDDTGAALGGVTVSTTVDGNPVTITTPTAGVVGQYSLQNLPTPGTYVVTFTDPAHGSFTSTVSLEPRESATLDQKLSSGIGTVKGTVYTLDADGTTKLALADVLVTVGGTSSSADGAAPSTSTLSQDPGKGSFQINDLVAPGQYTLTFTRDGYVPVTVPLDLTATEDAEIKPVKLVEADGGLAGRVTGGPAARGATVTVTDGLVSLTAVTTSTPKGGYTFPGLAAGHYSVTVSRDCFVSRTALVVVRSAATTAVPDLALAKKPGC